MRHILPLLLTLILCLPAAAEPLVIPLPDGHICLDILPLPDGEQLLLLGDKSENAVRLAATDSDMIIAISGSILPLDEYDPELAYFTVQWQTGQPIFWWGTSNIIQTREIFLWLANDAVLGWHITGGYVDDPFKPLKYSFFQEEPGLLRVSGDRPYPELEWPTDFSMMLNGFTLSTLEAECLLALDCLEALTTQYDEGDDIPGYTIHW